MSVLHTVHTAMNALRRNVMRAILTTLGIMIGVGAVIAMVEIGQGSASAIAKTISSMGANNLLVLPGAAASGGVTFGGGSAQTLTPQDAEAILRESVAVKAVAPIVRGRGQIVYGSRNWVPAQMNGSTPAFLEVRDWSNMAEGEMFTDQDVRNLAKVCVLGQTVVRELFDGESPIGKEIRVKNVPFKVVGVLRAKGANMMGMDQDVLLLAPWTTIKNRITGSSTSNTQATTSTETKNGLYPSTAASLYPSSDSTTNSPLTTKITNVDQILVSARSARSVPIAIEDIKAILRERHHIRAGESEDFNIRDMSEMTKAVTSTSSMMTNLLLCVALISLVVGGVGIMNIMLVSVTERTREIGLRMAVGARGRDILCQFLVEAVVLCLAGGAIGIVLGRGSSYLVTAILGWPVEASLEAILGSVLVSAGVGIIFGFYPAWKASRLDPIEALRYE